MDTEDTVLGEYSIEEIEQAISDKTAYVTVGDRVYKLLDWESNSRIGFYEKVKGGMGSDMFPKDEVKIIE